MLQQDVTYIKFLNDIDPIRPGVFPVPDYNLLGKDSSQGVTSSSTVFPPNTLAEKTIVHESFGTGAGTFMEPYLELDSSSLIFFSLITLVDTLTPEGGAVGSSLIYSRNHPDVIGEGSLLTKAGPIDYVAFMTPENERFAVVNMRLFNLRYGDVIVLAPHRDGTFRSLQLRGPKRTSTNVEKKLDEYVRTEEAIEELLLAPGTIPGVN